MIIRAEDTNFSCGHHFCRCPHPLQKVNTRGQFRITQKGDGLADSVADNPCVETLYRYPRGIVGFALLLLRIAAGILLLSNGCSEILRNPNAILLIRLFLGLGMCFGLLTSFLGIVSVVLSLWALFWGSASLSLVQVGTLILGVAIAILGGGAYSVDGLLFGRRRVIL
jgi:hypothetical protein